MGSAPQERLGNAMEPCEEKETERDGGVPGLLFRKRWSGVCSEVRGYCGFPADRRAGERPRFGGQRPS